MTDGLFVFLTKFLDQTRQVQTKFCLIVQFAVLVRIFFQKRRERKTRYIFLIYIYFFYFFLICIYLQYFRSIQTDLENNNLRMKRTLVT